MAEQQSLHFDAPEDDPVAAYLASGLTSLNDDQVFPTGSIGGHGGIAGHSDYY